ncbi:MAG: hypothetical protein LC672_00505, partial [Acidobacteria bacterium]|nr:hypothetical protein [Acidobacteriota bacterium]
MRWITRIAVFVLSLSLGASAWYILGQKRSDNAPALQPVEGATEGLGEVYEPSAAQEDESSQLLRVVPVEQAYGFASAKTVVLRESPDRSAPVVVKLKTADYENVEILDATRDFLKVRFTANYGSDGGIEREKDYEGWANWGSITPNMSAIVLDADTGEVVSRVPLKGEFMSVAFSPDGGRAIFYGGPVDSTIACEAKTSDYTFTR